MTAAGTWPWARRRWHAGAVVRLGVETGHGWVHRARTDGGRRRRQVRTSGRWRGWRAPALGMEGAGSEAAGAVAGACKAASGMEGDCGCGMEGALLAKKRFIS